jgi:translation initiation factor IF-2
MNADAALQMAVQRIAAVMPLAQVEGLKLGVAFDAKTPGALEALRECLKAYRSARQNIVRRDLGEVVETPQVPTAHPGNLLYRTPHVIPHQSGISWFLLIDE